MLNITLYTDCFLSPLIARDQYNIVAVDVLPVQDSYEIGSRVLFNCTLDPSTRMRDGDLISYQWTSVQGRGIRAYGNTFTDSISVRYLSSVNYYCHAFRNGHLLAIQKVTLNIKGIILL